MFSNCANGPDSILSCGTTCSNILTFVGRTSTFSMAMRRISLPSASAMRIKSRATAESNCQYPLVSYVHTVCLISAVNRFLGGIGPDGHVSYCLLLIVALTRCRRSRLMSLEARWRPGHASRRWHMTRSSPTLDSVSARVSGRICDGMASYGCILPS